MKTPLLDKIRTPKDLKSVAKSRLNQLADELRLELIDAVSQTGGHLGAGLGVVELTLALHFVFDTPKDKILFDVGHQAYPHKILTNRRDGIRTLRQPGGLSGFTKRDESPYDPFGAAHSSTAMSAGLGMAVARDLSKSDNHIISVVGDGAMSAGMAYEAMNNAGALKSRMMVVLNDNEMSIAPPVGALSAHLSHLLSSSPYITFRELSRRVGKRFVNHLPHPLHEAVSRMEKSARSMIEGTNLFEALGFYYIGPIDGHDLDHLIPILENLRDNPPDGPCLLHVVTQKGKGYAPAEGADDKYHGVAKFDVASGKQQKSSSNKPNYTKIFGQTLCDMAKDDEKIIGITAAMPSGTGINLFQNQYPNRCFDVGIAEQHGVTFAAGLACEGYRPFVAIYSTFLQRAYDQVVHDVAIQSLPVRFILDRAGFVGADGATHCGAFDIGYLAMLPNFIVMAPADEVELAKMLKTMQGIDNCPSALRYPRGDAVGVNWPESIKAIDIGKGRMIEQGQDIAIISYGTRLEDCKSAAQKLKTTHNIMPTVIDARFAKPLDEALILKTAKQHKAIITVEEGAIGGFSAQVMDLLMRHDLLHKIRFKALYMTDEFIDHNTQNAQLAQAGLDVNAIYNKLTQFIADL